MREIAVFLCIGGPLENRSPWPALRDSAAYAYGLALGTTFHDLNDNIMWSLAQDSRAGSVDHNAAITLSRLRNCAEGITDGIEQNYQPDGIAEYKLTFMTFHCQEGQTSAEHYHD